MRIVEKASFGFNLNKSTGVVLLDIEKAFDSVWHDGLIHKLKHAKYPLHIVKLVHSFLKERQAFVSFNGSNSKIYSIPAGVPQD